MDNGSEGQKTGRQLRLVASDDGSWPAAARPRQGESLAHPTGGEDQTTPPKKGERCLTRH
jgi:hypothetical protein